MVRRIILLSILLISLTGCNKEITNISSNINNNCIYKPELFMEQEDRNIYTYCLDDVKIKFNDKEKNLKDFIKTDEEAIDKIIGILEFKDVVYDGGSKIYKGENVTLIKCNTLDGNKDIYIGDQNMKFKENFCDNDNYTFVRTYTVKNIKECNEGQLIDDEISSSNCGSYEVELSQFQQENQKIIIGNLWDVKLEVNKTYEFEFQLNKDVNNIEDSIENIFENSTIVEIRETNKKGLDQTQEPICKTSK